MLNIESWLPLWSRAVLERFGGRVLFLGLQGSRAHGEAREDSDIDTVLALCWLDTGIFPASRADLPEAGRALLAAGPEELFAWAGETLKNVF
uniref:nucleotidyltransferase domain-containing protein n=1 Tax=Candidatus Scatomorpha intestinigallinarum TaxID=2840923 RepID=UPI0040267298